MSLLNKLKDSNLVKDVVQSELKPSITIHIVKMHGDADMYKTDYLTFPYTEEGVEKVKFWIQFLSELRDAIARDIESHLENYISRSIRTFTKAYPGSVVPYTENDLITICDKFVTCDITMEECTATIDNIIVTAITPDLKVETVVLDKRFSPPEDEWEHLKNIL